MNQPTDAKPAASDEPRTVLEPDLPWGEDPSIATFAYTLSEPETPLLPRETAATLAAWREMLIQQGLVNLTSSFEMAHAFGSLSVRDPESAIAFTMTQPGGTQTMADHQLLRVQGYNLERTWVEAVGAEPPSIDTLIHAALFAADTRIQWVFQCRSEVLTDACGGLSIPVATPGAKETPDAPAPAWSRALRVLNEQRSRPLLLSVPGRQANIFACGATARDAGGVLLIYLARALELRFNKLLAP